jgi:serine/threonine protein kinase
VTFETGFDQQTKTYEFVLHRNEAKFYLFTKTAATFEQWKKLLNFFALREGNEVSHRFREVLCCRHFVLAGKGPFLCPCQKSEIDESLSREVYDCRSVFQEKGLSKPAVTQIHYEIRMIRTVASRFVGEIVGVFLHHGMFIVVYRNPLSHNFLQYVQDSKPLDYSTVMDLTTRLAYHMSELQKEGLFLRQLNPQLLFVDPKQHSFLYFDLSNSVFHADVAKRCEQILPGFIAPEIIKENLTSSKSDVFIIGVLAFILTQGVFPFRSNSAINILKISTRSDPKRKLNGPEECTINLPQGQSIVMKCMMADPHQRSSLKDLLDANCIKQRMAIISESLLTT